MPRSVVTPNAGGDRGGAWQDVGVTDTPEPAAEDPRPVPDPVDVPDAEPEVVPELVDGSDADATDEPEAEPDSVPEPVEGSDATAEPEPEPERDSVPEPDEGSDADATDEHEPEPELEPEPEPDPVVMGTDDLAATVAAVRAAVRAGECIVLPTDTVYGIGADAFSSAAVQKLLDAKERGRDMPPPVLIADAMVLETLADDVPYAAKSLVAAHWPGPLTLIFKAQSSLRMDLGETDGTIAVRVPDNEVARAVLRATGPLAVSSANVSGQEPATNVDEATAQLRSRVAVYVDGGPTPGPVPSTIVDFTATSEGRIVRMGVLPLDVLQATLPAIVDGTATSAPEPEAAKPEATEEEGTPAVADSTVEVGSVSDAADAESTDLVPEAAVDSDAGEPAADEAGERPLADAAPEQETDAGATNEAALEDQVEVPAINPPPLDEVLEGAPPVIPVPDPETLDGSSSA